MGMVATDMVMAMVMAMAMDTGILPKERTKVITQIDQRSVLKLKQET